MSTRKRLDEPRAPHPFDFMGTLVSVARLDPLVLHCRVCHHEWRPTVNADGTVKIGYSICPNGCDQASRQGTTP